MTDDGRTLPLLIGLCGKAGAGKTTAADYLAARYGYARPHIGGPLKAMLRALLADIGYSPETAARYVDGDRKRDLVPELGKTSTELQQSLGTEWGRVCVRDSLWLDLWLARVAGMRAVQESVRFENEAIAIRQRGGVLIEIRRPGLTFTSDHVSEAMPFSPDIRVLNDGPPEILHQRIEGALRLLGGRPHDPG